MTLILGTTIALAVLNLALLIIAAIVRCINEKLPDDLP